MGPIGSTKYTVYKSPTEEMKKINGIYAPTVNEFPDYLIGSDVNIYRTQQDTSLGDVGNKMPKLNSAQDILSAKRNASAAAGGSVAGPNILNTSSANSVNPSKGSLFGPSTLTQGQQMGIGVANYAMDTIGEIADAKKNLAVDEYLTDLNYWKEQGKYWFDKDANYAPTFEEYAPNMPSAADTLKEGSMTGSNVADSAIGGAAKGAASGAVLGSVVPVIGTAVGAIGGAVVGGLTGLITGFMAGEAAEKQDAKTKQRAYDEYKAKLKTWTYSRNLKNQNDRIAKENETTAQSKAILTGNKALKQQKIDKIAANKNTNKNRMLEVLRNMGSAGNMAAQQRKTRWQ